MTARAVAISCLAALLLTAQPPPDPVIEAARIAAAAYQQSLPDYIVKRTTTRYRNARMDFWHTIDTFSVSVVAQHGREVYSDIVVNGKPAKELPVLGAWSTGEFSAALLTILPPERAAVFSHQHAEQLRNRAAIRYDFAVDQSHSAWLLAAKNRTYSPAYRGGIWIDKQTAQVLRFQMSAQRLPAWFALKSVDTQTDFDFVPIGDRKYMLPIDSVALTCEKNAAFCLKNETVFTDYDKFVANTSISFDETTK